MSDDPASADSHVRRLADGAIEPPFLIGTSCGSCHIAFDPLNPPEDPANPEWANIKGAIGNQYLRISELLASGMPPASLEYQVFRSEEHTSELLSLMRISYAVFCLKKKTH